MAKKITVDQELCIGCGACENLCPEVFQLQAEGKAKVISENGRKSCDCEIAMHGCPVGAIKIVEE